MTAMMECIDCEAEYDPDEEGPRDHARTCFRRQSMVRTGRWDDPEDEPTLGMNPPCGNCGFDGLMDADENGSVCPECGEPA